MANKRIGKEEASKKMNAADKRIKGISSIADSTIRRSKVSLEKQYGTSYGNRQAVTSVDKALNSLAKTTAALAVGIKTITVETARGVKNITAGGAKAMSEYAKAISEDIHINRQNFMVTTIGKFTPLVGYAVAKMMETTVFRNMIDKMKVGLSRALNSVTSRFKRLASMGWEKGKEFWSSMKDRISGTSGAVKTKMANARAAKKEKKYFTKEAAIKDALADANVASAAKKASRTKNVEKQVPHMASGGYVKKEGLAKVHAAEVVQPVDKIVDTIVNTVNKRLDEKEKREGTSAEGFASMFKKNKEQDFFGFDKVGTSFKNAFQIMQRKNLALEQRVMKRDAKNQRGLIGSFMTAYSEEAKQEELPLMERQVRATLAVKEAIAGENKNAIVAWQKMLYEHPFFHAILVGLKGLTTLTTAPLKFIFRKRGLYSSRLKSSGTVFERLYDSNSLIYTGLMEKMDDLTANTYVTANATNATASKTGAIGKHVPGTIPAPKQKGWSLAGVTARLAYGGLKYGAKAIGWGGKKLAEKYGGDRSKKFMDFASKDLFGKDGHINKAFFKKIWAGRNDKLETQLEKRTRWRKEAQERKQKNRAIKDKRDDLKSFKDKVAFGYDKRTAAKKVQEERKVRMRKRLIPDAYEKMKFKEQIKYEQDVVLRKQQQQKQQQQKKLKENKEKYKKKYEDPSTGKDRTGGKTFSSKITELVKNSKSQLKVSIQNKMANVNTLQKLKSGAKSLWTFGAFVISWLMKTVMKLPTMLGSLGKYLLAVPFVKPLLAKLGIGGAAVGAGASTVAKKPGLLSKGATALAKTKVGQKVAASAVGKGVAKLAGKTAVKFGLKTASKQIPILGGLVGLGLGIRRAMKGDFVGAGLELTSGVLGSVGFLSAGASTVGSLGIEGVLAYRDIKSNLNKDDIAKKAAEETKKRADKYRNIQASFSEYLPVINQFAGATTTGALISSYLQGKLGDNPDALLKAANAISKLKKDQLQQFQINPHTQQVAKAIVAAGSELKKGKKYLSKKYSNISEYAEKGYKTVKKDYNKLGVTGMSSKYIEQAEDSINSGIKSTKKYIDGIDIEKYKKEFSHLSDKSPEEIVSWVKKQKSIKAGTKMFNSAKNSSIANKVVDVAESSYNAVSGVVKNPMDFFSKFLETFGGNPKQFYLDTKEKLWGGIAAIKKYAIGSYKIQKSIFDHKVLQATGKENEISYIDKPEAQERLGFTAGINGKKVAGMNARHDLFQAALNSDMMQSLQGVKNSVDMGTKSNSTLINTVNNNSQSTVVSNGGSGGNPVQPSELDDFVKLILTNGLS